MRALVLVAALMVFPAWAVIESRSFDDPGQQSLYHELIAELRCLVCQNQNLADSNADLAKDLRQQTYEMITAGAGKQEIVDFMVERYGDFVLYRPPFKLTTAFLWIGPFVLLVIGFSVIVILLRRRSPTAPPDEAQKAEARKLLDS